MTSALDVLDVEIKALAQGVEDVLHTIRYHRGPAYEIPGIMARRYALEARLANVRQLREHLALREPPLEI